jgi:hypothetical protein
MTLFQLTPEWIALSDLIDETGGELTPEVEAAYTAMAADLQTDTAAKLESCLHFIRRKETDAAAAKAEAEQYLMMSRVAENAAKRTKDMVKIFMDATGQKSCKTTSGRTFAVQANGGVRPIVYSDAIDPAALPPEFQKVRIEIDKDAVRKCLEADEPLAFARLEERGTHLRVK